MPEYPPKPKPSFWGIVILVFVGVFVVSIAFSFLKWLFSTLVLVLVISAIIWAVLALTRSRKDKHL